MLTSLLIAVSFWGTDPDIVFEEARAPLPKRIVQAVRPDPSPSTRQYLSASGKDSASEDLFAIRGQSLQDDNSGRALLPGAEAFWENGFVQEFILGMNPFLPETVRSIPNYYDPFGFQMGTGSFGRQGYRIGWVTYNDITVLPAAPAFGTTGNMKIVEWNSNVRYSHLLRPGVLFNATGIFNARWWDGPGGINLPGQVDQVSTDLELGLFNNGPWSGQIAFHPQIVESYNGKLDRNAFNFDGRAVTTFQVSPRWSLVGGVAFWDRVDLLVVPHAGVIWTPTNRWELRLLYPKSRISYFLGNWNNADFWVYGQAEYTAEAYQASIAQPDISDRIQITDDRLSLGIRSDTGRYSFFAEGGYVFNRQIIFAGSTPAFNLGDSAMIRVGVRY